MLLHVAYLGEFLHHQGDEAVHLAHESVREFDEGGLVVSIFLEGATVLRGVPEVPEERGDVCVVRHLFVEAGVFNLPVEQQQGQSEGRLRVRTREQVERGSPRRGCWQCIQPFFLLFQQ